MTPPLPVRVTIFSLPVLGLIAAILDFGGHLGYIKNGNNFIFRLAHVFKQLQVRKSILLKK